MRAALCLVLLASTALLAGCVDDGYVGNGARYDGPGRSYGSGVYVRQSRYDVYRAPEYNARYGRPRYDRDDRYDRRDDAGDRYSTDRRVRREQADRDAGNRYRRDRDMRDRDDRDDGSPNRPRFVCEYPCIR